MAESANGPIPAKAGIHGVAFRAAEGWAPAYAGVALL